MDKLKEFYFDEREGNEEEEERGNVFKVSVEV